MAGSAFAECAYLPFYRRFAASSGVIESALTPKLLKYANMATFCSASVTWLLMRLIFSLTRDRPSAGVPAVVKKTRWMLQ